MKKIISTLLMMSIFALVPATPAAAVQPYEQDVAFSDDYDDLAYDVVGPGVFEYAEAGHAEAAPCRAGTFRVRRNTRTKKKVVNSLIAGGIGAAIGGGVGGGRGALVGLGAGSGGYLVYRYVRDRKGRCVPSYVRRG